MKKLLLASVVLLALGVASATAADIPRRQVMPAKAPVYVPPPLYNWTGFYVGINGGGGWGRSDFSAPLTSDSFRTSGGLIGGTLGYNYQVGQVVFGLEGDLDWSNIRGSGTCAGLSCSVRNNWLGTARGRIGYAFDRFMPFVTGGAAFGNIKASPAAFAGVDNSKLGWTLGGGGEFAIAGPWTAKLEYLYVDLGKTNCPVGNCAVSTDVNFHTNLVRAGLNYRF